jgi:hypothetical protein
MSCRVRVRFRVTKQDKIFLWTEKTKAQSKKQAKTKTDEDKGNDKGSDKKRPQNETRRGKARQN